MTDTSISDAVVFPQDEGTGVADGSEDYNSAGFFAALSRYRGDGSYVGEDTSGSPTLQFSNVDTTNETADVGTGFAYIMEGGASVQSGAQQSYDTTLPVSVPYVVALPSSITLSLDTDTTNEIWLAVDPTANDSVYIRHGSGLSAPSDPSVKLGTVNTSDGSTTRTNDLSDTTVDNLDANSGTVSDTASNTDDIANKDYVDTNSASSPHDLGGSDHNSDTLSNLNSKVSDATLDDSGDSRPPQGHDLGGADHNSDTLSNLNSKVSDATLDDSSDSRPPNTHDNSAHSVNYVTEDTTVVSVPITRLQDGEEIGVRVRVLSGETLTIDQVGVQNASNNAPSGLTAEVVDETNSTTMVSQNSTGTTVSSSKSGAISVNFKIVNSTGSEQDASAYFVIQK